MKNLLYEAKEVIESAIEANEKIIAESEHNNTELRMMLEKIESKFQE